LAHEAYDVVTIIAKMDQKIGALYGSLGALLDLEDSVKSDKIDDSRALLEKMWVDILLVS
jgi:citrate lyase beta subunit